MAMTDREQQVVERATRKIVEQQDLLKQLTAPAYHVGTVADITAKTVVVETNGQLMELDRVEGEANAIGRAPQPGDVVNLHPQTGGIVRFSEHAEYGGTGIVTHAECGLFQVGLASGTVTTKISRVPVAVGDHVVLGAGNHVILAKVEQTSKYAFRTQSVLEWADIAGCEDAKRELQAALEAPFSKPGVYAAFKKKPVKGGLLWGRPGNGKTLLGRACAGSLARVHGKESAASGFIYIKGPEILDKYVGETEEQIRVAFEHGKAHFRKHGYPAVLFVDEADAVLMRRGSHTSAGMEQTIVPQFLSEMDGIEDSGVFVLLATNRADTLDPAVIRPGRCDRKFFVGPPTRENAPQYFDIHMRDLPLSEGATKDALVDATVAALFGDKYPLYRVETQSGSRVFGFGDLVSGAYIAGIVERATAVAIERNDNPKKVDGLRQDDFDRALCLMHREEFGLSHVDALKEWVEANKLRVSGIRECRDEADAKAPCPPGAPSPAAEAVATVLAAGLHPDGGFDA